MAKTEKDLIFEMFGDFDDLGLESCDGAEMAEHNKVDAAEQKQPLYGDGLSGATAPGVGVEEPPVTTASASVSSPKPTSPKPTSPSVKIKGALARLAAEEAKNKQWALWRGEESGFYVGSPPGVHDERRRSSSISSLRLSEPEKPSENGTKTTVSPSMTSSYSRSRLDSDALSDFGLGVDTSSDVDPDADVPRRKSPRGLKG